MADGNLIRKCVQMKFGVAVFMVRGISKNPENPTYIDLMLTNSSDSFKIRVSLKPLYEIIKENRKKIIMET